MAHVSKKKLSEQTERALKNKLVDMLRIIGQDRHVKFSLNELLTFTEGIMLAKRLSIIYLVNKEMPTWDIARILNVSTSTVIRIEKIYDRGGYKNIETVFKRLEPTLLDVIKMIHAAMPSKVGKGRWKNFFEDFEN